MLCQSLWIHAMLCEVQKRDLRKPASHFLDIDWDSCHYVHNIAKCFRKPFKKFLESLFSYIYTDFYYSRDSREVLVTIWYVLSLKHTKPPNFAS